MNHRKRIVMWIVSLLAMLLVSACIQQPMYRQPSTPAQLDPAYESDPFYDALAPHGTWMVHPTYGRVWYPNNITRQWRPYTDGHWKYSPRYGWVWVEDQEWGWAPFHYGRWTYDDWYGWLWIPGRVWAPAWVYWRYGGGHAAWAPMPPTAVWRPDHGMDNRFFRSERDLSWDSWVSIPEERMFDRDMHRHIIDRRDNLRVLRKANATAQVKLEDGRVVNEGVPADLLEKTTGKKVEPAKLIEVNQPNAQQGAKDTDGLKVFRPQFGPESNDDLRKESARAETLARQLEDQQNQRNQEVPKEGAAEPRQPGRLIEKGAEGVPPPQPAEVQRVSPTPAKDPVRSSIPSLAPPPNSGPAVGSKPVDAANPPALTPGGQAPANPLPPGESQPVTPQEAVKNPAEQEVKVPTSQAPAHQGQNAPSVPTPAQPTTPSPGQLQQPVSADRQTPPPPPPAVGNVPPKSVNPADPKSNKGATSSVNDAQTSTPERVKDEPRPVAPQIEPIERAPAGAQGGGAGRRSQPGDDQVKAPTSEPQTPPTQLAPPPRTRNDENRLGIGQPERQQPQPASPARDAAPQHSIEPLGQQRSMPPQERQINPSGEVQPNKKQPKKPGEPDEEVEQQNAPPQK